MQRRELRALMPVVEAYRVGALAASQAAPLVALHTVRVPPPATEGQPVCERPDLHGAVVVPEDAVKKIPDAVDLLIRREAVVLEAAKAPDFNFEKLKAAIGTQADIH